MRFHNPLKRPKVRIPRPRIRIRWRKSSNWWAVGVAVAFFATLFAFHVVLMRHAESIIRDILDSRVRQATEGFYSTGFDHIELSYTNRDLIIHNLRLYPDSSRLVDANGKSINPSNVFDILIPQLRIEGIHLKKAYISKNLEVDQLGIIQPDIKLFVNFDLSPAATDSLKKDINQRLAPFFKSVYAQKVLISEGKLDLQTQKNGQKSRLHTTLSFEADKLQIETAVRPQDSEWIQVERFLAQAGSVSGFLADDTYQLRLKSITASSTDSSFFIQDFRLTPTSNAATLISRKPDLDRIYTIRVPQLYTYGVDYQALYNHQNLIAGEITLLSPSLEMYDAKPKEEGEKENFKPEDLYPAIEKVLNKVAVEKIFIKSGSAQVRNKEERFLTTMDVNISDGAVFNFELDSAAQYRTDKLFFADSARFHLRNYQLRLSDNLHLMKADELLVNSNTSSVKATNLRLEPDTIRSVRSTIPALYEASVPKLSLAGVDLLQLYNYNHLLIDSLLVLSPTIRYSQQYKRVKKQDSENTPFQEEDLYALMADYLYQLNIKRLSVDGGAVSVYRGKEDSVEIFNTRIQHAYLWNLQVDSSSAYQLNKLFYADNFDVEIADYRHKLPDGVHAIEVKTVGVSTLRDQITISGFRVYNLPGYSYPFAQINRISNKTLMNIQVPYLELNGVDILRSYLDKKLEVREVVLPNPVVHIASQIGRKQKDQAGIIQSTALYDLIEDFAEVVSVQTLRLSNAEILTAFYAPSGLLQLNSQNASVSIDNFRFDGYTSKNPKRLFFADAVTVSAQDFLADLPDERYQLKADLLQASTATQSITAEGVTLLPPHQTFNEEDLSLKGKKGVLSFTLPVVRITGVDFDRAYYEESLHVDSIIAESPSLTYLQLARNGNGNKKKKPRELIPQTSLYESLSPFFQHLSVGSVQLEDGVVRTVSRKNGTVQQNMLLDNITVAVTNFVVDSAADSNVQRFFYSEDIRVHIGEYRWFLPDNEHQITAGNLDLSTRSNLIRASSVQLTPIPGKNLQSTSANRYNIKVPEILLIGIPFDDIFEKEEFKLKKLELLNPSIEVRQYAGGSTSKKEKQPQTLPEILSAGLNLMQIDEAVLTDGSVKYVRYGKGQPLQVEFPHVEARLTNFSITPRSKVLAAKPFFSDNLEVRVDDWKRLLPDSLHWLDVGTISFSAKDSLLLLRNINVYPDESKLIATNESLLQARVPTIRLEGLDYTKLSKDSLSMKHLWVLEPVINILQSKKGKTTTLDQDSVKQPKNLLSLIRADSIQVTDGTLVLRKASLKDTSRFELNNLYVKAAGFLYDSLQRNNTERILYSDNLVAGVKNYQAYMDNGFYEIEAKDIGISTGSKQLWADSLRITPALDKNTFARQKGYETDQYTIRNQKILVDNLDIRKLVYDKTIEADKLLIDGFNLYLYRDKRQPFPSAKRPSMPQKSLRNSDWKIMIRETEITNGYVAYAEQVRGAREEGFIDLTDLYMHADTISNYPAVLDSNYVTNIRTSMKLMGKGQLEAFFEIPMGDTTNQHMFYGSLDAMELDNFNPILEKTNFISIRSGQVDRINFKVIADADGAEGTMEFEYDNLRVALVNKRTGKPGGIFRQLASSVANMVVHSSNTINGKQDSLRTGEIEVERDEKRSIVNYWVRTLIGGFKSSIGI